jgi:sugar phosphate isomerase/epimerase
MVDAYRFNLTAFADEISPDLSTQIAALKRLGISGLDLRSVNGVNVLDLNQEELQRVLDACSEAGIVVQCIGSPVNKIPYSVMAQGTERDRLHRAIKAARYLNTKRIRLFSPEVPEDQHDELAPKIIEWMADQKRLAEEYGIVLIHENDARYWGAYPQNAKRLFEAIGDVHFRAAFDFANTVLIGFRPLDDWFPWILPHLDTLHIKDATGGKVVPAGQGDGQIEDTLRFLIEQGWQGPLTLEPHLQAAGQFGGFSGEQLFETAVNALRDVLSRAGGQG